MTHRTPSRGLGHLALALILAFALALPASARTFIRDAEIERTLQRIAGPVLSAAGLGPSSVRIIIVKDRELNAYVVGNTIFLHTGLLSRLDSLEMIQAVIAHEVAHITSGHVISRKINARGAQTASAIGIVLGGIAASQGATGGGIGIAAAGQEAAKRAFLSHTRAEEAAADQASVRYLARAGINPQAALDTLNLMRGQEVLSENRRDPYARTHPLTSRRISLLRDRVASTRVADIKPDPALSYWHQRMVAKLDGFLRNPSGILRNVSKSDRSEIAYYRRAIANHRMSNLKEATRLVDALIAARPDDPYYRELKGQFYLEAGQAKAAVAAYRAALARAPKSALIQVGLARSLLQFDSQSATKEALGLLQKAVQRDTANPMTYQLQALAYARLGDNGRASLATAERFALSGRLGDAQIHAKRALGLLPEGTPGWRKADDIIRAAARQDQR